MPILRPSSVLTAGSILFLLACAGLGERVEEKVRSAVAEQAEIALAKTMGVPRSQVEVTPVGDRFAVETPKWDGNCGLGPDATAPRGFAFEDAGTSLADCRVESDCKELFGFSCGKASELALVLSSHGKGAATAREQAREKELEAKGWNVMRSEQDQSVVLTANKGKRIKAVAVIATTERGDTVELLVAPIQ